MYRIGNAILILAILLLNVEGGLAGNSTYVDCICVESNSPTLNLKVTINNVENESAKKIKFANPLTDEPKWLNATYESNWLNAASEAEKNFWIGVDFSEKRDKNANLSEKIYNNSKAIESFLKAANGDKNHVEAWYNLGNAYYRKNEFQNASKAYSESPFKNRLQDDDSKSKAYFNWGNTYFILGKDYYEEADNSYTEAIKLNDNYSDAYNNLALVQIEQGYFSKANDNLNEVLIILKMDKSNDSNNKMKELRAWNNKGLALSHLKRYDEALLALQNATKIKENPYSYLYQGLIVAELDQQLQESLDILNNKTLHFGNDSLSDRDKFLVKSSIGNVYLRFLNYPNAISAFSDATSINYRQGTSWDNSSAWVGNGTALMHLKNRNLEALISFNRAIGQNPENVEAFYGKGDVLYELGCYEDAMKAYQEGLKRDKGKRKEGVQWIISTLILILTAMIFALLLNGEFRKHVAYKFLLPSSLMLQLFAFLFILYRYFPPKVVINYIILSAAIFAATILLWILYEPGGVEPWPRFEKTLARLFKYPIVALLSFTLMGASPIIIEIWETIYKNPYNIAGEISFIMIIGLILFFYPSLRILTSNSTDEELRKTVLSFHFCWLGLNSLYLSRLLWCVGWTELSSPLDIGLVTISKETPIMAVAIFLIFLFLLFIPYSYGWRQAKTESERLLLGRLENLRAISTILQLKGKQKTKKFVVISNLYKRSLPKHKNNPIANPPLVDEIYDQLKHITNKCFSKQISMDRSDFRHISATDSQDICSNDLKILAEKYIEETQKELDSLKQTRPQLWITAVSLFSPVVIQILGSWMIKTGLSSRPESLFSGLTQILAGI